jgi:hypothetical protein
MDEGAKVESERANSGGGLIFKSKAVFAGERSVGVRSADVVELGEKSGEPVDTFLESEFCGREGC